MGCSDSRPIDATDVDLQPVERSASSNVSPDAVDGVAHVEGTVGAAAGEEATGRRVTWKEGSTEGNDRRVGRPAAHRQRHRSTCPETGTTTYKNHQVDQLQADVKRGLGASLEAMRVSSHATMPLTREDFERDEIVVYYPL